MKQSICGIILGLMAAAAANAGDDKPLPTVGPTGSRPRARGTA
jgi:hypothetical protein